MKTVKVYDKKSLKAKNENAVFCKDKKWEIPKSHSCVSIMSL